MELLHISYSEDGTHAGGYLWNPNTMTFSVELSYVEWSGFTNSHPTHRVIHRYDVADFEEVEVLIKEWTDRGGYQ